MENTFLVWFFLSFCVGGGLNAINGFCLKHFIRNTEKINNEIFNVKFCNAYIETAENFYFFLNFVMIFKNVLHVKYSMLLLSCETNGSIFQTCVRDAGGDVISLVLPVDCTTTSCECMLVFKQTCTCVLRVTGCNAKLINVRGILIL